MRGIITTGIYALWGQGTNVTKKGKIEAIEESEGIDRERQSRTESRTEEVYLYYSL